MPKISAFKFLLKINCINTIPYLLGDSVATIRLMTLFPFTMSVNPQEFSRETLELIGTSEDDITNISMYE